ncbi:MAG: hypothetical protein MJ198_08255 [Bacteroidales bacterium]|nr:hypothetical protein [Bacteroidales bacterium]
MTGLNSGNYIVMITDDRNCQELRVYTVEQPSEIKITVSITNPRCGEESKIELNTEGTYNYLWNTGSTEKDLIGAEVGDYHVTVTDPSNGCKTELSPSLKLSIEQPEISLVTVSKETGKNLVVWVRESTDQIDYYTIYREEAEGYRAISTVSYKDISVYVDEEADPNVTSWSYKISATDYCGNETELSSPHRTLFLQKGLGMLGAINLNWTPYEGIEYSSYYIIREVSVLGLLHKRDTITTLPTSIHEYTDLIPAIGTCNYYVGIKLPNVVNPKEFLKAESGPFVMAISNIAEAENEEQPSDTTETALESVSGVLPSVSVQGMNIIVKKACSRDVEIYDITGRTVETRAKVQNEYEQIPMKAKGVYLVFVGKQAFEVLIK